MWHGLRLLDARSRAQDAGVPLRVLTTTYIGGTERERSIGWSGTSAQRSIQYDAARTRLHAKAWLFRRDTGSTRPTSGPPTSRPSALLEGVEWNVRLSEAATPALLQKFAPPSTATGTREFEPYDPDRIATASTTR